MTAIEVLTLSLPHYARDHTFLPATELSRPSEFLFCVYLNVYGPCLGGTEQLAASVATLVYCPVPCHLNLWQGQPKD